uniref:EF-hand domain-containing protein n=1 Tax=Ascaris lumbricoides TaxID=6252 RepID=A0A0M3ILQ9_ASCLU
MRSEMGIAPLPDHFVDSLRILFDILDTNRTGHISYQQLCSRWDELPTPQLPPSFLHCLGRITPRNGMLTFERFLAAVRQSLNEQNIYGIRSESRIPEIWFGYIAIIIFFSTEMITYNFFFAYSQSFSKKIKKLFRPLR